MEELSQNLEKILNRARESESKWENGVKETKLRLQAILLGSQMPAPQASLVAASPQQMKKRVKRLSSIADGDEEFVAPNVSVKSSQLVISETVVTEEAVQPQIPEAEPEHVFARPMRAARLKIENCLKEPSISTKLRRPDNADETRKIKKESEQRASQAIGKKLNKSNKSQLEAVETQSAANESVASNKRADESVLVVADKDAPVVEISEEEDASSSSSVVAKKKSKKEPRDGKNPVVKVKKEALSLSGHEDVLKSPQFAAPAPVEVTAVGLKHEASSVDETLQTTISTASIAETTTRGKRGKKKKEFLHRPIKEERISLEAVVPSPVAARTRSGSISKPRADSIYEDAVDSIPQTSVEPKGTPPVAAPVAGDICNETVATNNATMVTAFNSTYVANQAADSTFAVPTAQTTFVMPNNANATVTIANETAKKPNGSLGDATFDVRDPAVVNDSIMTEDDSFEKPIVPPKKQLPAPPPPVTAKVLKSKSKANELFNPCVQSPVKKKVEAFENHAQTASNEMRLKTRSKRTKENSEPELPSVRDLKSSTVTTPVIGKPHAPVLGRFLTPTQQSNVALSSANAKKLPNSASKIMPFPTSKQVSASNLKSTSSSSSQSLSRENSEEDLKKGFNKLQLLAEERKKKREVKHQQAALIREAKEKERAERLKKIMKEREEKNRKKIAEMEQKKRELDEINRNLKLQEERELKQTAAAANSKTKVDAATEAARQERELLEQMKMPKMKMPPPPKLNSKYNFNMLHSDDSTDEEGKTSYKRPAPPQWSRSSVRTDNITSQAYLSSDIIDSFFSVQPMTPDLKAIFPNIDPRHLKRNSSAIWQTPPRYSEMPKY